MKFTEFYFKENNQIDNWKEKVNSNQYLKVAVEVLEILDKNFPDSSSYLVGGVVRDLVMGKDFSDIDIATNVDIDEIEKLFKTYDIGQNKKFQIVAIKHKGFSFEIAHFRVESGYSDQRRPDEVKPVKDFKQDAARRDITWNAMGVDKDGNVADHFGGMKDIQNKILKMVGNPDERFKEDSLRLARIPRFASRFDFDIDPATIEAMKKNAPEIAKVSRERIYKELSKMAEGTGPQFARAIQILNDTGLLKYILPEVAKLAEFEHSSDHHPEKDESGKHTVLAHVIEALKSQPLKDKIINLSVLLHDVGKSTTHEIDEKGIHRYFGHAQAADEIIDNIAKKLTMDNETKRKVKYAAIHHMKIHSFLDLNDSTIAKLIGNPDWDVLIAVAEADAKARGKLFDKDEWSKIIIKIDKLRKRFKTRDAINAIKKVVNGNLVMHLRPEIKPSKELGDIIEKTVDFILNNNIDLEKDLEKIKDFIVKI